MYEATFTCPVTGARHTRGQRKPSNTYHQLHPPVAGAPRTPLILFYPLPNRGRRTSTRKWEARVATPAHTIAPQPSLRHVPRRTRTPTVASTYVQHVWQARSICTCGTGRLARPRGRLMYPQNNKRAPLAAHATTAVAPAQEHAATTASRGQVKGWCPQSRAGATHTRRLHPWHQQRTQPNQCPYTRHVEWSATCQT